jgi:hypothetical protein
MVVCSVSCTRSVSSIIRVALSGPEEAIEAILAVAGHEVDMHVGDALTDDVVEGDKRSIGPKPSSMARSSSWAF